MLVEQFTGKVYVLPRKSDSGNPVGAASVLLDVDGEQPAVSCSILQLSQRSLEAVIRH